VGEVAGARREGKRFFFEKKTKKSFALGRAAGGKRRGTAAPPPHPASAPDERGKEKFSAFWRAAVDVGSFFP
jgi:hypothetical protein